MTGIILAGGKNSRIQTEKALLKIGEVAIIERIISVLRPLFREIIIVSNSPELYPHPGCRLVPDIEKGCGPLGGIHSGLSSSQDEYNFFFACDMPFLNEKLINYMIKESPGYDVTIPLSPRGYETLHAVYSRRCLPHVENLLKKGDFKILDFFPGVNMKIIGEEIIKEFDPEEKVFFNVNTKEDYAKAKDLLFDSNGG